MRDVFHNLKHLRRAKELETLILTLSLTQELDRVTTGRE